jgi:hypothetical protein
MCMEMRFLNKKRERRTLNRRYREKGQTALEYMMVLVVVIIPTALALRALLSEPENAGFGNGKKTSPINRLTHDAYGDDRNVGTIGRPFP